MLSGTDLLIALFSSFFAGIPAGITLMGYLLWKNEKSNTTKKSK